MLKWAPRPPGPLARAGARISASFDRLPIRVRLAGVSALLTFVILCAFALAIGSLTVERIRSDFNRQVLDTAEQLPSQLSITVYPFDVKPELNDVARGGEVINIVALDGTILAQSRAKAPSFGPPETALRTVHNYRVLSRP